MLEHDFRVIGNRMLAARKKRGMTQVEIAEAAGVSDRTYADIERGSVNMRLDTFLRICEVLHVSPNELLETSVCCGTMSQEELILRLTNCSSKDRSTILHILEICLNSLT